MMNVYMDNAATTRQSDRVLREMENVYRNLWHNCSGAYDAALRASDELECCRQKIAHSLNCYPEEVHFTSGGTEADNWGIRALKRIGEKHNRRHCVVSAYEHHAVLNVLPELKNDGWEITYINPVDGFILPEQVKMALRSDTAFVCVMYANNEIGTVNPVGAISKICATAGIPFFCDGVQAVGHIPVDFRKDGMDILTLSAHKFNGPFGVGALIAQKNLPISPMIVGGGQEDNLRAGTENLPAVAGMALALSDYLEIDQHDVFWLRNKLASGILFNIPDTHLVTPSCEYDSLPGIVNIMFDGLESSALLARLNSVGICASAGSACTTGSPKPSHVLLSMGYTAEQARSAIRFSLSHENTLDEVAYVLTHLERIVKDMKKISL